MGMEIVPVQEEELALHRTPENSRSRRSLAPTGTTMHRRRWRPGTGFSLVEGLIAAGILLVLAIGILPLFIRSIISNEGGSDYTQITNAAKERAEEFYQLPFTSDRMLVTSGNERVFDEYFSQRDKVWRDGLEADAISDGDLALFLRTTTVRQFNVNDLLNPLDSSAPPSTVQIKEVTVNARSTRTGGPLGPGKRNVVRVLKSQ